MNVDRARAALSALPPSRTPRRTGATTGRHRAGAIAAALALGAGLAVAGAAAPASAHHNTIQGRFDCVAGDATGIVTWTVENSEGIAETVTESSNPAVVPVGTEVAARAVGTFVQADVAPGSTVELTLAAKWKNGATHRDTGRVEVVAGSCDAEPPASLTGAVAVGECEADVPWIEYRVALDDPQGTETARELQLVLFEGDDEAWIDLGPLGDDLAAEGRVLWPGATVDEQGAPTGWPGWEQDASGDWIETDGNYAWTRDVEHAAILLMPETAPADAAAGAEASAILDEAPEGEPVAVAPVVIAYPAVTGDCTAAPALVGGGTGQAPTTGGPLASTGGGAGAGNGLAETGFNGTPLAIAAVVVVALGAALLIIVRLRRRPAAADTAAPDHGAADRDA